MSFIFFWSLRVDDFPVGKGEEGPAFAESDEDVSLCNEVVESLHEVFGDEISPSLLVVGILHDWSQDLIAHGVHVFEDILSDLDEDDVVLEVLLVELLSADPQDDEACVDA
jgi:hypothetical protein